MLEKVLPFSYLQTLPPTQPEACEALLQSELALDHHKIVVMDDDPTGIQTVHDIHVYTDWTQESIDQGFEEENRMFFILSNSRSMSDAETRCVHKEIAQRVVQASEKTGKPFVYISRSDSTLRGHFPAETETLRFETEALWDKRFDGEIICPFFCEGGRYTLANTHYVREGDQLTPASQTEFAKDRTFGYSTSFMPAWCEEKTNGSVKAEEVLCIPLEMLRNLDVDGVAELLKDVHDFGKVIVNAAAYEDVKVFLAGYLRAVRLYEKQFMFRSAAAIPKLLGNVTDIPLLSRAVLRAGANQTGGIILVGSHVHKTTAQLEALLADMPDLETYEFRVARALEPNGLADEAAVLSEKANAAIAQGKTILIYTSRERLDLKNADKEEQLKISVAISDAVTSIIARLNNQPAFIIAKGGITSSDVGVKALRVRKARVMGQVAPGIPVWETDEHSKFPLMPYVIFPGNVGGVETLRDVVRLLK